MNVLVEVPPWMYVSSVVLPSEVECEHRLPLSSRKKTLSGCGSAFMICRMIHGSAIALRNSSRPSRPAARHTPTNSFRTASDGPVASPVASAAAGVAGGSASRPTEARLSASCFEMTSPGCASPVHFPWKSACEMSLRDCSASHSPGVDCRVSDLFFSEEAELLRTLVLSPTELSPSRFSGDFDLPPAFASPEGGEAVAASSGTSDERFGVKLVGGGGDPERRGMGGVPCDSSPPVGERPSLKSTQLWPLAMLASSSRISSSE